MFKIKYIKIILFVLLALFIINSVIYAGSIENVNGFIMYKTSKGEYAKNTWIWLDMNGDSVKECYRFGDDGYVFANYNGIDGRTTNEKGQLIENGFVMQKLASGKVVKGDGKPYINTYEQEGNIINNTGSKVLDNIPFEVVARTNDVILTTKLKEEIVIPIDESVSTMSNIIYSSAEGNIKNKKNIKNNIPMVAGKSIDKYIISKNNVKVNAEKVKIYGDEIWEDVIELRGNNSFIKIDIKKFNYMYFEVAEENHSVDKEKDETVSLEVYIDGKLYDTLEDFFESEPQIEEIEELDAKTIEFKVKITGKNKSRRVYIRNGKLKKVKNNS